MTEDYFGDHTQFPYIRGGTVIRLPIDRIPIAEEFHAAWVAYLESLKDKK